MTRRGWLVLAAWLIAGGAASSRIATASDAMAGTPRASAAGPATRAASATDPAAATAAPTGSRQTQTQTAAQTQPTPAAATQPPPAAQGGTPASTRPRITGIAHVAFRVTALPAARAFYGDRLGLPQAGQENALRARFRVSPRQEIIVEPGLPAGDDERLSHVAFETDDLDALSAHLTAQGVAIEREPPAPASRCAARAVWVKDPDGHPLEFIESGAAATRPSRRPGDPPALRGRDTTPVSERLLHAGLIIHDAAAADRFYKTVLGFAEIWRGGRTDSDLSWINMKLPDGTDYVEYMLVAPGGTVSRQQRGVLHHVALLVPDIQAAYEAVIARTPAAGRRALATPQVGRNNRWQLNLYDPDGSRVELMEPFTMR